MMLPLHNKQQLRSESVNSPELDIFIETQVSMKIKFRTLFLTCILMQFSIDDAAVAQQTTIKIGIREFTRIRYIYREAGFNENKIPHTVPDVHTYAIFNR